MTMPSLPIAGLLVGLLWGVGCPRSAEPSETVAVTKRIEDVERAGEAAEEDREATTAEVVLLDSVAEPLPTEPAPSPAALASRLVPWALPRPAGNARRAAFVTIDGKGVIVLGREEFWRVELGNREAPTGPAPWMPGPSDGSDVLAPTPAPFGGLFLVEGEGSGHSGPLRAIDAETLRERWRVDGRFYLEEVGATEGTIVAATQNRIDAIDLTTGRRLWGEAFERDLDQFSMSTLAVDRGIAVVSRGPRVTAREARTGEVRWQGPSSPRWPHLTAADDGHLGIVREETIRIVDIVTGSELGSVRFARAPHPLGRPLLAGDWVYALATEDETVFVQGHRWRGGSRHFVTRLPFGAVPPLPRDDWDELVPSFTAMDGLLFVCRGGDVMHAVSASTGERLWTERGTPCHLPRAWHPHPGAAGVLFPDPWRSADGLALGAESIAPGRATVSGTVSCRGPSRNADVWIGEKHVVTDREGRFRASFPNLRTPAVTIHVEPAPDAPRTCRRASARWEGEPVEIDIYDSTGGDDITGLEGI